MDDELFVDAFLSEKTSKGYDDIEHDFIESVLDAGTPPDIVSRLQTEIAKALKLPEINTRLAGLGAIPSGNTPQEFARLIDSEIAKWAPVVKAAGARVD